MTSASICPIPIQIQILAGANIAVAADVSAHLQPYRRR
jgi:hypothetical protein